ncbi:MAG TPA: hypothetical protein PK055_08470 [Gammaproteobacteria bacterium]|nr:hypothetical protein [Xanthomonadales bacterium]HOP22964.1 hypothetical protein [Gammaproteobacteria bacterium]HPI96308.1 hypothetical protein [Gammaproteobacteria bacterium]HPQ87678.1 hypothetical protein [Gammaproteobacteria bacterium]
MTNNDKDISFNERQLKRIFYRRLAVVLWTSFLVAAAQTMVFFAIFDPQLLLQLSTWSVEVSATQGYTFGFVFFWVFSFVATFLVGIVMVLPRTKLAQRTRPKEDD